MRKVLLQCLSFLTLLLAGGAAAFAFAESNTSNEYKVKAAYLYNVIKFVKWPRNNDQPARSKLKLCTFDQNPFKDYLKKLESRQVRGLDIEVSHQKNTQSVVSQCDLVFIPNSHANATDLIRELNQKHILTIGENKLFLNHGGMISLQLINNRIQLLINRSEAQKAQFIISAQLLEVAKEVL